MIIKMMGPHIEQEVSQKLIQETLPEALQDLDLDVISQPVLEDSQMNPDEPFIYTVMVEVRPTVEVDGYKGLTLEREKVDITDEMVDKRLEDLLKAYATIQQVEEDRPVKEGDLAVIDYTAYVDDRASGRWRQPQLPGGSGRRAVPPRFRSRPGGHEQGARKKR